MAGPVRADGGDLLDRAALGRRELLGDLARDQREDDAGQHGVEDLEVVHVVLRHQERTDHRQDRGQPEAAVDRGQRVAVALARAHRDDADHRGDDAHGRDDEGVQDAPGVGLWPMVRKAE